MMDDSAAQWLVAYVIFHLLRDFDFFFNVNFFDFIFVLAGFHSCCCDFSLANCAMFLHYCF